MTLHPRAAFAAILVAGSLQTTIVLAQTDFRTDEIKHAFAAASITLNDVDAQQIAGSLRQAHDDYCRYSPTGNNSKVKFAAIEIAQRVGMDTRRDASLAERISGVIKSFPCSPLPAPSPRLGAAWEQYYRQVTNLTNDQSFLRLVDERGFDPVKISWEDIGRYEGSVWGDRISDVGIWVRKNEDDPASAALALSVRRDSNFRDKVLMVPIENIKVHLKDGRSTRELALLDRLRQLDLTSRERDRNVIVSNQFAIVPVPSRAMWDQSSPGAPPPRAAFTFSIYPYGSTNYVITDVIEGSSDAVVGPGAHQLLYADINGKRAPFTASRAEDRADLVQLEADLKAQGMDVDVQRYYLIQIPLRKDGTGITLSNMGSPPFRHHYYSLDEEQLVLGSAAEYDKGVTAGVPSAVRNDRSRGLSRVAIGHGETEGAYFAGAGFRGMRAEEPIRVTVVYFVTPIGEVTPADMESFAQAFAAWDSKAIWGGSFVVKE